MSRLPYKDLLARSSHPSDEDLVALVSNEPASMPATELQKHLDGCWHCQARHEEFKRAIIEIVQSVHAYVGDLNSRSRVAKVALDEGLSRLSAERRQPVPFTQLRQMLESTLPTRLLVRQMAFGVAAMLIMVALFPLVSSAPVSAEEFLLRSKLAEQESIQAVPDPAIHGKFRVTKTNSRTGREQSVTWEIWDDTIHNRVRTRFEDEQPNAPAATDLRMALQSAFVGPHAPPLVRDLQQVFATNGLDARNPLSPSGFDNWRCSLHAKQDKVIHTELPGGVPAMAVITTPAETPAQGHIVSAELIVRARDWHAVENRFVVQGADTTQEYDVRETAYQVVAAESIPSGIFAPDRSVSVSRPRVQRATAAPQFVLPSVEQLDAAELSAKFALHQVDEFLRGQIQVERDSSKVKIEGLVDDDQRKTEVTAMLASIPYAEVSIRTTEEALSAVGSSSAAPPGPATAATPFASEPDNADAKRNQEWIRSQWNLYGRRFPGMDPHALDEQTTEISNQAIDLVRAASLQAWALRRLAQNYPAQRVAMMNASPKWLLQTMVRDHAETLGREIQQIDSLVHPVLNSFANSGKAGVDEAAQNQVSLPPGAELVWQEQVERLFTEVDEINTQILGVFGNPALLRGSAEDAVGGLLDQLTKFPGNAQRFEQQIGNEFAETAKVRAVGGALATAPVQ